MTTRLLAIFPHPDDESYGPAGALARADYAAVFCLTRGEASSIGPQRGLSRDEVALFLFSAARSLLIGSVIAPALERDDVVVCDRYIHSTAAYQGYGRGLDLAAIRKISNIATITGRVLSLLNLRG